MPLFRKSPPQDRERTAEERALEREHRERRRAEREGDAHTPVHEPSDGWPEGQTVSDPLHDPLPAESGPVEFHEPPSPEPPPAEAHDPSMAQWAHVEPHEPPVAESAPGEIHEPPVAESAPVEFPDVPAPVAAPVALHDAPRAEFHDAPTAPPPSAEPDDGPVSAPPPAPHNPPPAEQQSPLVPPTLHPPVEPAAHGRHDPFEYAVVERESDTPVQRPPDHHPQDMLPEVAEPGHSRRPPMRRTMAGAAGRIPPPPTRRDALLERRTRRLHGHRGDPGRSRSLVRPGRIVALLGLVLVAALLWFAVSLFQPFNGAGHGRVVVVIPRGSGAHAIGDLLASRGVVASGFFFNLRAAVDGKRGRLHSGVYTFQRDMSYGAAISELVQPPPPPPVVRVLIPEGDSRSMIARIARDDGLAGDYLAASRRSPLLDPTSYGAPRGTPHLEGFLYPATYDLKAGTDASGLVGQQVTAFKSHFGPSQAAAARAQHVTLYGLLTVASMVEREALLSRDRPLVAAVIYNRLSSHTPLGIDATIRYALNNWSSPLTVSDLHISSAYNTRTHVGLPPTPIGNPGMASINAAAHPAHVPYMYYVDGSDGCGDLKFSTSFSQFQADSAAYQAALARNGGRVPSCKR